MSVADRVTQAIDRMCEGKPEAALHDLCSAIDTTATQEYGQGGRSSFKRFLHDNLDVITQAGLGRKILNINLNIDIPDAKKNLDGSTPIQEVLYHAVRCGLYHEAELPSTLQFHLGTSIHYESDTLCLPAGLIHGLLIAVITSPVNRNQSIPEQYTTTVYGMPLTTSSLCGRRSELRWLYEAILRTQRAAGRQGVAVESDTAPSGPVGPPCQPAA